MKVTPEFIVTFETALNVIKERTWDRVTAGLMWDKVMKVRESSTKKEILTWLLPMGRIYNEGNGGNTRFDDIAGTTFSYENDNAGTGLKLTKNEIEDNQMARAPNGSSFDYAMAWAADSAAAAAFYPQQSLFNLITNGTTATGYDGVSFFNAAHPVNPNGGAATYSNIITGADLRNITNDTNGLVAAQSRFATALASVRAQKQFNGIPRYLKPTVMLVPTALQYQAQQMVGAAQLGITTNIFTGLNIEVIVDPLLDAEPTVYYLGVEDLTSDSVGAFIWSQREPFTLRSYSMLDESALNRRDEFEWTLKGRNTAVYGHPYLMYRCTT